MNPTRASLRASGSLRRRLTLSLLLPLVVLIVPLLAEAYFSARESANRAFDRALRGSAIAIAERVVIGNSGTGELEVDLPYVALEMLSSTAQDRVFYRVSGPDDVFITGYRDLPDPPADARDGDGTVYYDARVRGDTVRVAAHARTLSDGERSLAFQVLVAETVSARDLLARELMVRSASRLLLLTAVAAVIVWFAVGRGLAPLARLARAVARRSEHDLSPLAERGPDEVAPLVAAINALMQRLGANIAAMHRFIDDASHQLRTPLASLKTHAELVVDERDERLREQMLLQLRRETLQTSRLAEQLLTLARAAPDAQATRGKGPVEFAALAAEVTAEWVPRALAAGVDLGFENGAGESVVRGDRMLLAEALGNLVDNAIRYAGPKARVTVRLVGNGRTVRVEVEDDGPGIPERERDRVLERFYRMPGSTAGGCGLGLAIVREIVRGHGGDIVLQSVPEGRGLSARIVLPLLREG